MDNDQAGDSKGTILIVDDTAHVRQLLSAMLRTRGYNVQTAEGGLHALEVVQEVFPDLILLDIMMPQMDGYEVCERLKDDPRTRDIPVIFISALEQTDDKIKAFNAGGVDYVPKPFQIKEVLARVSAHLALRSMQKQLQAASAELAAQLEELQARNEELDAFAEAIARDLKAPLTSIIGFADMLRDIHATMPAGQLEESLLTISSSGIKMNKIIDDLLLLAGLRQAQQVDFKPLDMVSIVDAALDRLSDVIAEYQANIAVPSSWPRALGYRPWVEEVWVNTVRSALEYGARPPHLELGATSEPDGSVRFWVRDRAADLEAEGQATPFAGQHTQPASDRERGLGMFVVRRIMERLGRMASAETAKDQGNILSFTLRGE
jgi:two-component system sensor histidine kinase/response regulator